MRVFYVYNINDYFCSVYDKYPYKLYKMLEEAYLTKQHNIMLSSSMYEQIITNNVNNIYIQNAEYNANKYHRSNNRMVNSTSDKQINKNTELYPMN